MYYDMQLFNISFNVNTQLELRGLKDDFGDNAILEGYLTCLLAL